MPTYLAEFEFVHQFRCSTTIEAESWAEAEAIASAMVDDIPEEDFEDAGFSEREAYIIDEL